MKRASLSACWLVLALVSRSLAKFDCVDVSNPGAPPPNCPDPAEEPWCACVETFVSPEVPGEYATITQELVFPYHQPTAGEYIVDVSGGTLDLSSVQVDDEIMSFLVDLEIGQPERFILDLRGVVTEVDGDTVKFDVKLLEPVNAVTEETLTYTPTDDQHSFGKLYEGVLTSLGPDKGFVFEYRVFEPEFGSKAIEDGDLDAPNFSIPALVTIVSAGDKRYKTPCAPLNISTTMVPKVQSPEWFEPVPEEFTESEFPLGSCEASFRRGDADAKGTVQLTDAVYTLSFLFVGGPAPPCMDAADSDDDGIVNITDPIAVLGYLFLGTAVPAPPGPLNCGPDVEEDTFAPCVYTCP